MKLDIDLERDELARRLGGGLPQGSLCLIMGPSGSGKSVLSQRLAYGLIQNGIRTTYVSTEFTTPAFLDQMEQLDYAVMDPFLAKDLLFSSTIPLLGHPVKPRTLLPRLWSARKLITQPAVIVDTFSRIAEPHLQAGPRGEDVLEHTVRNIKRINSLGTTLVLTLNPEDLQGIDTTLLKSSADVFLECTAERLGGSMNRFVQVRKFARASNAVGDLIPFRVEPGAGFIVEIRSVA